MVLLFTAAQNIGSVAVNISTCNGFNQILLLTLEFERHDQSDGKKQYRDRKQHQRCCA